MKKKLLLSITILLFACSFISINSYAFSKNEEPLKKESPIVTLTSSNYEEQTAKGVVIVDFWAAWCGPCRKIAPILEDIAKEYESKVKVGKLNVDNYKKFSLEKKIQAIPTLIIYKDGKEMKRILGAVSKEELKKVIEPYLSESAD